MWISGLTGGYGFQHIFKILFYSYIHLTAWHKQEICFLFVLFSGFSNKNMDFPDEVRTHVGTHIYTHVSIKGKSPWPAISQITSHPPGIQCIVSRNINW